MRARRRRPAPAPEAGAAAATKARAAVIVAAAVGRLSGVFQRVASKGRALWLNSMVEPAAAQEAGEAARLGATSNLACGNVRAAWRSIKIIEEGGFLDSHACGWQFHSLPHGRLHNDVDSQWWAVARSRAQPQFMVLENAPTTWFRHASAARCGQGLS